MTKNLYWVPGTKLDPGCQLLAWISFTVVIISKVLCPLTTLTASNWTWYLTALASALQVKVGRRLELANVPRGPVSTISAGRGTSSLCSKADISESSLHKSSLQALTAKK